MIGGICCWIDSYNSLYYNLDMYFHPHNYYILLNIIDKYWNYWAYNIRSRMLNIQSLLNNSDIQLNKPNIVNMGMQCSLHKEHSCNTLDCKCNYRLNYHRLHFDNMSCKKLSLCWKNLNITKEQNC